MLTKKLFILTALIATLSAHAREFTAFDVTCELKNGEQVIDSFTDSSYGIYENSTSQFVNKLTDTNGSVYMLSGIQIGGDVQRGYFPKLSVEFDVEDKVQNIAISDDRFELEVDRTSRPRFHVYANIKAIFDGDQKPYTQIDDVNFDLEINFTLKAWLRQVKRKIVCKFTEY